MCYDTEYSLGRQLREAQRRGASQEEIDDLYFRLMEIHKQPIDNRESFALIDDGKEGLLPYYHVSGFAHPKMVVMTDYVKPNYEIADWGFVAKDAKTYKEAYGYNPKKPWMNNLNIQVEKMFESYVFRNSARYGRCVIKLEGFYEHHHQNGNTYPFHIQRADNVPMWMAGIYNNKELLNEETGELVEKKTMGILTTKGNCIMSKLHNNPSVIKRSGPRMPCILEEEQLEGFLKHWPDTKNKKDEELFRKEILAICQPLDEDLLKYVPVRNLKERKGMPYIGNVPEIRNRFDWEDLDLDLIFG